MDASAVATTTSGSLLTVLLVIGVALAHFLPDIRSETTRISRHSILSIAGGISLVYAFLHLFPELDAHRGSLAGVELGIATLTEHHIYILVFVGVALFYGLERIATVVDTLPVASKVGISKPVFWVHIGGFVVYNAFIGYVLVQGQTGTENTVLFAFAMAFHLFGNDEALEQHYQMLYRQRGRWILASAVVVGAVIGAVYTMDDALFTILLGLLTGGVVFNAIKDELPRTRESRFWAFVSGALVYAAILVTF
ncbi:hypothetical protein [Natrialba asiatica]|uniref:Zinc/iron permease n=1 Tax=Natrialba asiatica (strain ATCC 700177 / DSM 12278 / JCM 9576 / FERM P-10747 / NBRC 102637 / 172P1) TaxID=29540 RepID=M0B5J5_NATA1|nr:hypothetical protein [Natrialba asiatica]ELZ05508.1 hypothetical protein C481_02277 [Natrialba asiatica DSM 12278]